MSEAKKILWFEGAGMPGTGGAVGNCRLRTALTNDEGISYYLEVISAHYDRKWLKRLGLDGEFTPDEHVGFIDFAFRITADPKVDDCNESRHELQDDRTRFHYTLDGILDLVNRRLGCSFDEVRVAPEFSGYRVFTGRQTDTSLDYSFGDEFVLDEEATEKITALYERECARQRDLGERYPDVSIWRDEKDADVIHVKHHNKRGLRDFDIRISDL